MLARIMSKLKGTALHPQWMSDRCHIKSKKTMKALRGMRVLDIGSGNNSYKSIIKNSNQVISLDYPATNKNYCVRPDVFADARCLPMGDETFDVVLLYEVLEHVDDQGRVLKEIHRILRNGGRLYMSVPFIYPIHDAPNDYWRFTVHGVEKLLYLHGFEKNRLEVYGNTFVAAAQMLNLALLELCRDVYLRQSIIGVVASCIAYPITILVNFIALPLVYMPLGTAGNLGYFVVATKKSGVENL